MNTEEFKVRGKEMVDYICQYTSNLDKNKATPDVEPGYLRKLLPSEAPQEPENWDSIMRDVVSKIMPGVTHWQHPRFHAYFPSGNSYPSMLGEMLSNAISCIGFSWASSPACTELEIIVLDWFGKAIGLPDDFITSAKNSKGGGAFETSASECVLVCMLAARNQAIQYLKRDSPNSIHDSEFLPKLICYASKDAHSCVEKAAKILLVKIRTLDPDENGSLRGETVRAAMEEDIAKGLFPFLVTATLGTTGSASFDNLEEIGPVCKLQPCTWLHVDAAYAGSGFILPELKYLLKGVEYIDSFNTNPNKWLLTNFDCSCLWVRCKHKLTSAFVIDPVYLQHANSDEAIDYRHWGIPLSRRFRSLKLWFVLRNYGLSGLQNYMRNHIKLAKYFESLVRNNSRFEVVNDVRLGLVCFRLRGPDSENVKLLTNINASGELFMVPSIIKGKYSIRFCVVAEHATQDDMDTAWKIIQKYSQQVSPRPRLTRQKSSRLSFTRSVSKEMYQRSKSKSNLLDGATPILVVDSDEDEEGNNNTDDILDALTSVSVYDDDVFTKENEEEKRMPPQSPPNYL
ncbi:tyrosine decarboxylase-like isoform X2 [Diabrotica virgifera virgifera]|uniref:Tyrosine decarboxylase-like n=1 Tax=Diabrotica virgifera virgifera TaxID=50390 RepID=A0A6P7GSY1_DIAVI|nr:tyrosine decarboxylase-like isoform X2 [Diabrotica virgifera virgifera]